MSSSPAIQVASSTTVMVTTGTTVWLHVRIPLAHAGPGREQSLVEIPENTAVASTMAVFLPPAQRKVADGVLADVLHRTEPDTTQKGP